MQHACPECGEDLDLNDVIETDIIGCDECDSEFEVIALEPVKLELITEDPNDSEEGQGEEDEFADDEEEE